MALDYPYERVLADSNRYEQRSSAGKFLEWWLGYIGDEGWKAERRPFLQMYDLWKSPVQAIGILGMEFPQHQRRHIVAVDAAGVVDPADGFPDHIHLADYVLSRREQGAVFDSDFLMIYWA